MDWLKIAIDPFVFYQTFILAVEKKIVSGPFSRSEEENCCIPRQDLIPRYLNFISGRPGLIFLFKTRGFNAYT